MISLNVARYKAQRLVTCGAGVVQPLPRPQRPVPLPAAGHLTVQRLAGRQRHRLRHRLTICVPPLPAPRAALEMVTPTAKHSELRLQAYALLRSVFKITNSRAFEACK